MDALPHKPIQSPLRLVVDNDRREESVTTLAIEALRGVFDLGPEVEDRSVVAFADIHLRCTQEPIPAVEPLVRLLELGAKYDAVRMSDEQVEERAHARLQLSKGGRIRAFFARLFQKGAR
ncbi:hypothetical protein GCM10007989_25440 [Devosia pacifica]|uniref:Uncharacterized protein n=1 Tax=Devosia pacifica TaxID=1335967 RepID=A0A918S9E6_9HYPH|nr:hypothetical protein [Devosia pacifica]GHA28301.1 hypothetical protein GCM10007989_25440 [Devosia pacifica]